MTVHEYVGYLAVVVLVVLAPGPDTVITLQHSVLGGLRGGARAVAGICAASLVQGSAAALGVGALITGSQPVFTALRWLGAAYLCFLGARALWSACCGNGPGWAADGGGDRALRAGFHSNITNPKILALYLSVLPQFLHADSGIAHALLLAYTVAVLGSLWLLCLAAFVHRVRPWLARRVVRRLLDAVAGAALVTFGARLASD
ncbi:LysE family translocator [Nocardia fusca]|uniref:LysE family translocator n=1 Tax=Nocardia fusca TaxID=941183 RepID=UPI0007A76420|nr:LysE family translocator [Nocardia fusca]